MRNLFKFSLSHIGTFIFPDNAPIDKIKLHHLRSINYYFLQVGGESIITYMKSSDKLTSEIYSLVFSKELSSFTK